MRISNSTNYSRNLVEFHKNGKKNIAEALTELGKLNLTFSNNFNVLDFFLLPKEEEETRHAKNTIHKSLSSIVRKAQLRISREHLSLSLYYYYYTAQRELIPCELAMPHACRSI